MRNNIYIDIGNTLVKINYFVNGKTKYFSYKTKKKWTYNCLYKIMPLDIKKIIPKKIYVCSVVLCMNFIIDKLFIKYWNIIPEYINAESDIKILLDIDNKNNIGADLISLACYLNSETNNGIMINMGTATTIIHVKNQKLKGVIIAPGLTSSFNSLINSATQLNSLNIAISDKVLGTNTKQALSIGILHGHSEMIKGLASRIDSSAKIFISGGDASKIHKITTYKYVKEATIEGIKIIGRFNDKQLN